MLIWPGGHKTFEYDFCTLLEKRPKRKLYPRIQCSDWTKRPKRKLHPKIQCSDWTILEYEYRNRTRKVLCGKARLKLELLGQCGIF